MGGWINSNLGLNCTGGLRDGKYPKIIILAKDLSLFRDVLKEEIPECMHYKLGILNGQLYKFPSQNN